MKSFKLLIFAFFLSLISCDFNKHLDIPQQGVLAVEETYQKANDEEVLDFIAAVYFKIHSGIFEETYGGQISTSAWGLRAMLAERGGEVADYYNYLGTSETTDFANIWSYYYSTIYWCNMLIENLPSNKVASDNIKNQVVAEARTIRAISMMYLVQLYGNPPLADHIMTGKEGNTPAEESWVFIENELNQAAQNLPSKNSKGGQSAIGGRLTKEAAFAYLGKAYLWQKKYSEAANTLYNKVIATDLYELIPDFKELNRYTSDFCSEYIWEFDLSEKAGTELSQAGMFDVVFFNWSATKLYIPDTYFKVSGFERNSYLSESFGAFMDNHDVLTNGVKTERYRGTVATYEDILDPNYFTYSDGQKGVKGIGVNHCEGYFRIKLTPREENIMGTPNDWVYSFFKNNFSYMRYSEVLLNYAEAVAMGGNPGAMTGLEALNIVRRRAGLPDAPVLEMENEEYGLKAEKRAEFLFEGIAFIDLVRWGDAPSVLSNCGVYSPSFYGYNNGNNSVIQSKENWKINKIATLGKGFKTNKDELFPIPLVELNSNPNLVQNPGW
jgi:hypothetical protein